MGKAPWYRKALHWLTAGFFRVSRITKATQAELGELIALTGLNIHIPHLEFISGEHLLKSLGAVATENIWDYITLYVDNYLEATNLEQEQSIDNSSILDDCTSAQEDVELDEDYDSGTIVIKNNSTEQSANDTIVIKSQQEDAEETEDYDTGTMVIKKKSYKALSSETMRVNKSNQLNNSDLSSSIVISDSKATSSDEQRLSVNNSSAAQINALNPISFFSRRKSNTFVRFDTFTTTVKRGDDTLTELFKRHHQIKPHVAHIQWGTDTLKSPRNSLSLVSPSNPEDSISFNI